MNCPSKKKFCYYCKKQLGKNHWIIYPWKPNVIAGVKIDVGEIGPVGYCYDSCNRERFEENDVD